MFPNFKIASKKDAELLLYLDTSKVIKYVVSIGDPNESPPRGVKNISHILRLEFFDTDTDSHAHAPSKEISMKIIEFAKKIKEDKDPGLVLFHCFAGISRSSAAAYISNFVWGRTEEEALDKVYIEKDTTSPNPLMVLNADHILGSHMHNVLSENPIGPGFEYPNLIGMARGLK